jgi:hypothetical protein
VGESGISFLDFPAMLEHFCVGPIPSWDVEDVHFHLLVVAEHTKEPLAF